MVVIQLNNEILRRVNNYNTCDKVTLSINSVEIPLNKSIAIAASQMMYSQYLLDNSISKIDTKSDIRSQDTYNILKDIFQYNKTEIECDETILKDLFQIGLDLEMHELTNLYKEYIIDKVTINKSNCVQLLEYYFDISSEKNITECIDYISSHFFGINETQLKSIAKKLGLDILKKIINNNQLAVKDEDSLASFIISLAKDNEVFYLLIENIHFEFCTKQIIDEIQELTNANNCLNIVKSLHDSLLRIIKPNQINPRSFNPDNLSTKINEYLHYEDFESIYSFMDRLSEEGNKEMMNLACNKKLHDKKDKESGSNILIKAAYRGNLRLVKSLIECGCNKEERNNRGITAIGLASYNGHLEVVKYLFSVGAD